MANTNLYDEQMDEILARHGTFDITGTDAVSDKNYWGFVASEGAVLAAIKGIALKSTATSAAEITSAEVDLASYFLTALTDPLLGGIIYRVPGYIITHLQLTSGTLHCILTEEQPT